MKNDPQEQPQVLARNAWLPFLLILTASALAHLWCLASQFYMDDMVAIHDNEMVRNAVLWPLSVISFTQLGYIIQFKLFGVSAVAFHAVNWLLHTAVACTLFAFGRDFIRGQASQGVALLAALWFAVHPLASEIPNYARTQDLAWVTLFSLLASWSLLRFLREGGWRKLLWTALGIIGATYSKGPGFFHAVMMTGAVGLAFMTADHWKAIRRHGWLAATVLAAITTLFWITHDNWYHIVRQWGEPRFIGHAYTLGRVFWEFAWRALIPIRLCSDHHIAESLVPPGYGWLNLPDKTAMAAAAGMLGLTALGLFLACRRPTRLLGICLFLFVATILFRVTFLVPEFMPEYRIYPGMPWFCLGGAILLGRTWRSLAPTVSPAIPSTLFILMLALLSARRSFVWHDLDRLTADILRQYPAQARAIWELHDRDIRAGDWQKVIDRQQDAWPRVFAEFIKENQRLAPRRELPSGHFALADVACKGRYAIALAHVAGPAAGLAEIDRLEQYMRSLRMDPVAHQVHWGYFHSAKAKVLEQSGDYRQALEEMRAKGAFNIKPADIERVEKLLAKPPQ